MPPVREPIIRKKKRRTPSVSSPPSINTSSLSGGKPKKKKVSVSPPPSINTSSLSGSGKTKPTSVLSDSERRAASRTTQKSSTKKLRKKHDKAVRKAELFRGVGKPKTKREKQLVARGKAVRSIFKDTSKGQLQIYQDFKQPKALRAAQIQTLHKQNKKLETDLKKTGKDVPGGVELARQQRLQSLLAHNKSEIARLKNQELGQAKRDLIDIIKETSKLQDKSGIPQGQVKRQLTKQGEALAKINTKRDKLSDREDKFKTEAQKKKRQFSHRIEAASEYLSDVRGDLTSRVFVEEQGIRVKGKDGRNVKIKVPGSSQWSPLTLDEPSSALEDAIEPASYVIPFGLAGRAGRLALGTTRLGRGVDVASAAVGNTTRAAGKALAFPFAKAGRGVLKSSPKLANVVTGLAAKAAISRGSRKVVEQVAKEEGSVASRYGQTVLQRMPHGPVDPKSSAIADAIDGALISVAQRVASTIPKDLSGFQVAARTVGRKSLKGGAFVGGATFVPQVALGVDPKTAAGNIFRDAHDLMVGFFPSTYELGAAGYEAVFRHDDSRFEKLKDAFLESDPIWKAIQGDWEGALEAYKERPFSTALELAGAEYALGASVGTVARTGLLGGKVRGLASTADIVRLGPNDTLGVHIGQYSRDPLRKLISVGSRKARSQSSLNRENLARVYERVDRMVGTKQNETLRMLSEVTDEHLHFYNRAHRVAQGQHGPDALPFMVSRIARKPETAAKDLAEYKADLLKQIERRDKGKKYDQDALDFSRETIRVIDSLLEHPQVLANQKLWDIADEFVVKEGRRQTELAQWSTLTPHQQEAAAWIPYMVRHMDATKRAEGWKVVINGEEKIIDLSTDAGLQVVRDYAAKDMGGVAAPGFVRLQGLNEKLLPTSKRFTGKATAYHSRTHKAVVLGTFDPTFNALYSHSMRLHHTILDGEHAHRIAEQFSALRTERGTLRLEKI